MGLPLLWVPVLFGFFAGDTMIAGFALEIVPTHYRATVGALRYAIEIGAGAVLWPWKAALRQIGGARLISTAMAILFPKRSRRERRWRK